MENNANSNRETEQEISLVDIFNIMKNNIGTIIGTTLIGLIIAAVVTFLIMTPQYSGTTDLVVNDRQEDTTGQEINQNVLQTNFTLLSTYQSIIEKPIILQPVIDELNLDLTVDELAEMTTMTTDEESLVFSISVESESPYLSADIANAIADSFSTEIKNILNVTNVTILTEATPEEDPISPQPLLNLLLGTLIGLVIGIGWTFIKYIFDRSVRNKDIISELGWTMLGTIPEMTKTDVDNTRLKSGSKRSNDASKRRRV